MKKRIIIFGAGEWGRLASYYYKDKCEIICFCDNSSYLWGKKINDIEICSPQKIKEMDLQQIRIVIANKHKSNEILEQLNSRFGVVQCIIFKLETNVEEYIIPHKDNLKNECMVRYMGGLGNQMFQYSLAKCLAIKGGYVTGDLSAFFLIEENRDFLLENVFPKISIKKCNTCLKRHYKENTALCISEQSVLEVEKKEADVGIIENKKGYFEGYWQTYQYAKIAENELRSDFSFIQEKECKLVALSRKINQMKNAVSVHIRRGDYLEEKIKKYFGNICTEHYYENALKYIESNVSSPFFIFFSNDIMWTKENYKKSNAIYISADLFDKYEDWYDMFLMSCCKHNIIANSTFSWWGAWLNANKNKIVVAPSKWINSCNILDIYPPNWIRI